MNLRWLLSLVAVGGFLSAGSLPGQTDGSTIRFQFREPHATAYRLPIRRGLTLQSVQANEWLRAWPEGGSANFVELGSRVVLQLTSGVELSFVLKGRAVQWSRTFAPNVFVLQATDAWTAMREAEQLAQTPGVIVSTPVKRRQLGRQFAYAGKPNDSYFDQQWHLENRDSNAAPLGVDLNVRSAWPWSRGEGVIIGVADDGIDMLHPDLVSRLTNTNHHNFNTGSTDGNHPLTTLEHGTAVAGLAGADGGNGRGVAGVAPSSQLASWVIFPTPYSIVSDEQLADMFQFRSNVVAVQNHSWASSAVEFQPVSLLEQIAISNAVTSGRGGRGVVIVRAAANLREGSGNMNDDAYAHDPQVICVAAVRDDGRVASYSNPGAALLVAAPSAEYTNGIMDTTFRSLFTTDRVGTNGWNSISFTNDLGDYRFDSLGFGGTSGATPQISGLAALILSANTNLACRDVQQILALSSRHYDLADPLVMTNGAGFRVSYNVGFGVPDAGQAVRTALGWSNRPPLTNLTFTATNQQPIPDPGLRLLVTGSNVPPSLAVIAAIPSEGLHADAPTVTVPLVDVGQALAPIPVSLTNKGALIQRGANFFRDKIGYAAQAGASLAVIYNNSTGGVLTVMGGTDFVPIPAVFISRTDGEALRSMIQTNTNAVAQIALASATYDFAVTNTLLCEHVGVRLRTDHTNRGELRLTLLSPMGTRSVLQRVNLDMASTLSDWTYYSTHHFYESSAGTWTVAVTDEGTNGVGKVLGVDLALRGVEIEDSDHDGLDDRWERAYFNGSLAQGPKDDPDGDGYSNMREQIMGTNPTAVDPAFQFKLDLSAWDEQRARVGWAATTNVNYEILTSTNATGTFMVLTNLPGRFPETEFFLPYTNQTQQFFRVRTVTQP